MARRWGSRRRSRRHSGSAQVLLRRALAIGRGRPRSLDRDRSSGWSSSSCRATRAARTRPRRARGSPVGARWRGRRRSSEVRVARSAACRCSRRARTLDIPGLGLATGAAFGLVMGSGPRQRGGLVEPDHRRDRRHSAHRRLRGLGATCPPAHAADAAVRLEIVLSWHRGRLPALGIPVCRRVLHRAVLPSRARS